VVFTDKSHNTQQDMNTSQISLERKALKIGGNHQKFILRDLSLSATFSSDSAEKFNMSWFNTQRQNFNARATAVTQKIYIAYRKSRGQYNKV